MTAPTTRRMTLKEVRETDATLFVRNNTDKPITCNTLTKDGPRFLLGRAGDDDSIQVLPHAVAAEPGFQRLYLRGDVTISDDPEMEHQIELQAEQRFFGQRAGADAVAATIEPPSSSRAMVEQRCLVSGELVFLTEAQVKEHVPPLAPRFQDRAAEWVATITADVRGNEIVTWSHPTLTVKALPPETVIEP